MRLAFTENIPKVAKQYIQSFGGINKTSRYVDNEFIYMDGISLNDYPYLSTRPAREEEGLIFNKGAKGVIFHNNSMLIVIDNEIISYKDTDGDIAYLKSYHRNENNKQKEVKFAIMGAYIVMLPDKVCYDTNMKEFFNMEVEFTPYADTVFEPAFTKSTFTRIRSTGIGNIFRKYDSVVISGCIREEYNNAKVITEVGNDFIVVIGSLSSSFTQSAGSLKFKRKVPDMSYICESNNRIWGCSENGHEIYASKLGDPFNFNNFENISTDSYAVNVGSQGKFTACIKHMGSVLFFKENTIHKLFGDKPSNFQINDYNFKGVKDGEYKSLQIINEVLYYVGIDGIYAYDGSVPFNISEKLGECKIEKSIGANHGGNYYLSAKLKDSIKGNSECGVYIYYPALKSICVDEVLEEKDLWKFSNTYKNNIYYLIDKENHSLYKKLFDDDFKIKGFSIAKDFTSNRFKVISASITSSSMFKKFVSKLMFDFELYDLKDDELGGERKAYIDIYLQYDNEPIWDKVYSVTGEKRKIYTVPIIPKRCESFKYKLEGRGRFILRGICKFVEEGSEVDGNF